MFANVTYEKFVPSNAFGVELEVDEKILRPVISELIMTVDPGRHVATTNGWNITGVAHGIPSNCWNVKTDSTCGSSPGKYGNEVASPKLFTKLDIGIVGNVANVMKNVECQVNNHCGVHIHADLTGWTPTHVGIMLAHWCKIEPIIGQMLPPHRRNNQYAKMMRKKHAIKDESEFTSEGLYAKMEPKNLGIHQNHDKRVAINLIGYATGLKIPEHGRKTAELRLPEGTLERDDVENWIRFYLHFIMKSRDKPMCNLRTASLTEFMKIMGLEKQNGFCFLDPDLHKLKVWILKRILRYTNDSLLFHETIDRINMIQEPLEKYIPVENAA